jgi:hypothetical protein
MQVHGMCRCREHAGAWNVQVQGTCRCVAIVSCCVGDLMPLSLSNPTCAKNCVPFSLFPCLLDASVR